MSFVDDIAGKWRKVRSKVQPAMDKTGPVLRNIAEGFRNIWHYAVKLRKVLLAFPVAWAAMILAVKNLVDLPDTVGLDLQSDGTFSFLIVKELAVLGPIAVTAFCLLLMFLSKRTLTPWLVSVFSLVLPLLMLITNTFPS